MIKHTWILIVLLFVSILVFVFKSNMPLTGSEIREGYTAYSILKTGSDTNGEKLPLLFRADGNFLSTFGVYLRVPSVYLFGLNSLGVRSVAFPVGILAIYSFYLFANKFLKDRRLIILGTIFFTFSPLFIYFSITSPGTIFILSVLLLLMGHLKNIKLPLIVLGSIFVLSLIFKQGYLNYIKRITPVSDLLPSSYSYQIDKRLSFDLLYGSPLVTKRFNFNRIVLNKAFYGINEVFKSLIAPFNFEKLFSPFQSQTVLLTDSSDTRFLPSFYFWELPVVLIGFLIFSKKDKRILYLSGFGVVVAIIFKNYLMFLLPTVAICEAVFLIFIFQKLSRYKWFLLGTAVLLYILSIYSFLDLFTNHFQDWMKTTDYGQFRLWQEISKDDLKYDKVYITDRIGEPVFYYLFYEQIDPNYYLSKRINGALVDGSIQKVSSVGNVFFGTFKYYDVVKKSPNELWIDMAAQFVGENKDYKNINSVGEGLILKRLEGINVENGKFLGSEVWFVKTNPYEK